MPCQEIPNCNPCNPTYTEVGCTDYPPTGCVIYNGDDIPCLSIEKSENLNDILQHLKDVICGLTPTAYEDFDFSCFASEGITTEQQFVEFISSVICEIIGTQTVGSLTSLSDLYTLITGLTVNVNSIKNQAVITCFRGLSGLNNPDDIGALLTAIQTIICDHEDRIVALEGGATNTPITAVDSDDIDITVSGTNNHTITASVILDPDATQSITSSAAGLLCSSPNISVVDTQSINFSASGTKNHTITGDVKISATAGNAASILSDGIYVADASTSETPITVIDSTSINFTASGTNNHTITAGVIIDPSITNILQSTVNGLLVSSTLVQDPITPIDSPSIDITVSGANSHSIKADVVISPNSNNALTALSNGLFVDMSAIVSGWSLSGNSISSGNFLGSTNNQPLVFKVNNTLSGKIASNGQTFLGYGAGTNNTSVSVTGIGYNALYNNSSGTETVAVGNAALFSNTTGAQNIAVGNAALYTNTVGGANTSVGHRSMQYVTGDENTALGAGAGKDGATVFTGDGNTYLGVAARSTLSTISKSVALGYNAVVTADNNVVIGGTGADLVSVVVGDTEADASAIVDLVSTEKGFLPPRMTALEAEAIPSPAEGLLVYATNGTGVTITSKGWWGYNGAAWEQLN